MICPHCGRETPALLRRCTGCGQHLRPKTRPPVVPAAPVPRTGADAADSEDVTRLFDRLCDESSTALTPAPLADRAAAPSPDSPRATDLTAADLDPSRRRALPGTDSHVVPVVEDFARLAAQSAPPSDSAGSRPGSEARGDRPRTATGSQPPPGSAARGGPLAAGQSFGSRYHVIKLLGVGGMGAVYQAWDAELDVAVALKVIRPDAQADPEAALDLERRFKRELLLARQVTHKNVVRIHDLGEIDGIKYITMPFVHGADLSTVLKEAGKLPVPAAMQIARQVVSGLQAAHDAGVVHRDLKPANIMIDEDRALIMDFGIARSGAAALPAPGEAGSGQAASVSYSEHTLAGRVIGTLEYMAPEQARGQPADQRADIYAFGLIFRDLLVGRRQRSSAKSAVDELKERLEHPPAAARSVDPQIPEALDRVISRCVEPDLARRYQTTAELAADLDLLDENGVPKPVKRAVSVPIVFAGAAVALALLAVTWWFARAPAAPVQHEPVSVLIADFDNRTNESVFAGSLESALAVAIEGASFITAYDRSGARRLATQLDLGATLDEATARVVSRREGIKLVLAGSVEAARPGYAVGLRAVDPADGKEVARATVSASARPDVLKAVGAAAAGLRARLGDSATESARLAAAETFAAASLDAMRSYALAQDLAAGGQDDEAIEHYKHAVEQDPTFGRAYAGWAASAFRLGRRDEAADLWKKSLSLLDRLSEREKYRTLGNYYLGIARNDDKAIENGEALVKLYPADRAGHLNLAFAYFQKRNFAKAFEEGRRGIEIYRGHVAAWNTYALYAMYASDFATAASEAERVSKQYPTFPKAYLPLAMAALANGKSDAARNAYARMAATGPLGASVASMGLADISMYEGRFAEAVTILKQGIADDQQNKNTEGLASKYIALGEAFAAEQNTARAVGAAERALKIGSGKAVVVPAASILLQAGKTSAAQALAAELGQQGQAESRAYAKILDGQIALRDRRLVDAVDALRAAQQVADFWLGRYTLGVAYVEAGHHAEAVAELELCQRRHGEATAIFLDEVPTFRYLAPLPYWLGRAKEELGMKPAAVDHYKAFLALRPDSPDDPLVADARRRLGVR